jgi:5-methylcytosine-specific restriction endonuclease McrBC GTP-binding regulatory subunit McrB
MSFKTVDGVFKNIADTALNDTKDKNYVIIIDEINRANISKVFGELITLIEEDKRWGELNETSATLQSGEPFAVPNNLYIVGTMNSADKSISLIDAALRRRFDFIEQKPDSRLVTDDVLKAMLENINLSLVEELDSTDLLVGHSYFMNKTGNDLCSILNNNIIPLLYEYFYDNRKKVANLLNDAIKKAGAKIEIVDEKVGRLRVKEV